MILSASWRAGCSAAGSPPPVPRRRPLCRPRAASKDDLAPSLYDPFVGPVIVAVRLGQHVRVPEPRRLEVFDLVLSSHGVDSQLPLLGGAVHAVRVEGLVAEHGEAIPLPHGIEALLVGEAVALLAGLVLLLASSQALVCVRPDVHPARHAWPA